jgi:glycosyltransferase involved in cell wall biosynthesis
VLAQTGETGPFEIVVVKDFADAFVDGQAAEGRILTVDLAGGSVGEYLAEGVTAAHGDVVCFLDDDDAFEPEKVSRVRQAFAEDPGMAYFHNGMDLRHDNQQRARGLFHQKTGRDFVIDPQDHPRRGVDYAVSLSLIINMSSVSVRRSLLLDRLGALREIKGGQDYFCFFVALSSHSRLRFTSEHLTTYYIHASMMRPKRLDEEAIRLFDRLSRDTIHALSLGLALPESAGAHRAVKSMLTEWKFLEVTLHRRSRKEFVRRYGEFVTSALTLRPVFVALATPILVAGLFSKRLSLWLLIAGRQVIQD